MGAVDLVVQVEAPPIGRLRAAAGRPGRAPGRRGLAAAWSSRSTAATSSQCAVVAERMTAGAIESMRYPRNPLDVLAQQIVAMVALEPWTVDDVAGGRAARGAVRRAAATPRCTPCSTCWPAATRPTSSPSCGRGSPGTGSPASCTARPGAQRLAVTSGGTIPDRGLFGVFLAGGRRPRPPGRRAGRGDGLRVAGRRRVPARLVVLADRGHHPRPGAGHPGARRSPARMPFWKGDSPGRPVELGRALGAFLREVGGAPAEAGPARAAGRRAGRVGRGQPARLPRRAARGHRPLPDDRTILVERFRDELGDWRLVVHSPVRRQVNAPWALAIAARLRERYGVEVQLDALRRRHRAAAARHRSTSAPRRADARDVLSTRTRSSEMVIAEVGGSALFASRFRECAARALLLPRRDPRRRTPLWQQRQRAGPAAGGGRRVRAVPGRRWRRCASACRTCTTCRGCAG